jgi:hypothetical protein
VSPRKTRGFDIGQLRIEWPMRGQERIGNPTGPNDEPPAVVAEPEAKTASVPALRLRWDFRTRFPQPTPEAVDAGLIGPEETGPEAVRAIHGKHASELLSVLRDMDAEAYARRGAPAPSSGRAEPGPSRLHRWYANLLGVYGDLFGPEAAEAFDKAVRAWHAHVEVVIDNGSAGPAVVPTLPKEGESHPVPTVPVVDPVIQPGRSVPSRVSARLPVPKPLPHAVAAGHFGHDEDGPVSPSADEVRAITEAHAELLIDMATAIADADRRNAGPTEVARLMGQMQDAVRKYAEDFGDHAAQRLLAYARRQAQMDEPRPAGRGR